jgi:hypothetical protein
MKKSATIAAMLVALVVTAGAVQMSSAAGSSSKVSACASKKTGAMRYVTSTSKCKTTESKLVWNAAGVQGSQGIQGIQGVQGVPGENGSNATSSIWIGAGDFSLVSGDAEHAYLGKTLVNGYYQTGYVFKDRAPNSGSDGIETKFALPANWSDVEEIDVTFYYTAASGAGNIQLWKGFGGFAAGQAIGSIGWNSMHFGAVNGNGTMEYHRHWFSLNDSTMYGIGLERSSDTSNTPDTNEGDVVFYGILIEPRIA